MKQAAVLAAEEKATCFQAYHAQLFLASGIVPCCKCFCKLQF